jgi:hypothetical protein
MPNSATGEGPAVQATQAGQLNAEFDRCAATLAEGEFVSGQGELPPLA